MGGKIEKSHGGPLPGPRGGAEAGERRVAPNGGRSGAPRARRWTWFLLLLIMSCVYPKKHIVSGQCKFFEIFHFTTSTDVLSESHFDFEAKIT